MVESLQVQRREWSRMLGLLVVVLIAFFGLLAKLAYEQMVKVTEYRERERFQAMRRIIHPGPRGNIFDRNGILLVGNRARFAAVTYLGELRREFRSNLLEKIREIRQLEEETGVQIETSYNDLVWSSRTAVLQRQLDIVNEILGRQSTLSRRDVERHFSSNLILPFTLANNLTEEDYARLIDQLPSDSLIGVQTLSTRYYPFGSAASHALGYVREEILTSAQNTPGSDLASYGFKGQKAQSGLEKSFDHLLSGSPGSEVWRVDPHGYRFEPVVSKNPIQGSDLHTSIDIDLQVAAEAAMAGKTGAVIALDVRTGEVLTIASFPDYDLNDFTPFIPTDVYQRIVREGGLLNRAIQGLYPPGSTFKPLTAIAALRHRVIEPDTILQCGGSYRVGNRDFREHTPAGFGPIALSRALAVSSNVFFYQIGLQTGVDFLAEESIRFNLHQPTGIELPYESRNMIVPSRAWKRENNRGPWTPGDTANFCIGQGFLRLTPIQMAAFTASIARGETHTRVTMQRIPDRAKVYHGGSPIGLPAANFQTIIDGMIETTERGTGRRAALPGIKVASKTGTAQVFPGGRKLTVAWFIGFAPADDPAIAVVTVVEGVNEGDEFYGGDTAAPIARYIFEAYFNKYPPASPAFAAN
ncbi:MAG: penicillin-binding transpeptidase domain-containing protein [Puniceicoccaceae bacterium]